MVSTPVEVRITGGGETRNGIVVVVVRSVMVVVVVIVVVSVHFWGFVDVLVAVTVVVWGATRCEQAEDIVGAAQFPRAVGVVG